MNATRIVYGKRDQVTLDTYSDKIAERFWSKVDKSESCWIWTASRNFGYGIFHVKRVDKKAFTVPAHRWSYLTAKGEIPANYVLDHLCRNRACVNPEHLEAVTMQVNAERGLWGDLKTHCPAGHAYEGENIATRTNRRSRECRVCRGQQKIEARRSKREILQANPDAFEHGTLTTYNDWMCRCQPCRDTQAAYQRGRRDKKAGLIY